MNDTFPTLPVLDFPRNLFSSTDLELPDLELLFGHRPRAQLLDAKADKAGPKASAGSLSGELKVDVVGIGGTAVDDTVDKTVWDTVHESAGRVSVDQSMVRRGSSLEQRVLVHVRPDQGIPESSHADAGARAGGETFIPVGTSEKGLVEPVLAQERRGRRGRRGRRRYHGSRRRRC